MAKFSLSVKVAMSIFSGLFASTLKKKKMEREGSVICTKLTSDPPASYLEMGSLAPYYDLPDLPFAIETDGGSIEINSMGRVITLPPFYTYTTDVIYPVGFKRYSSLFSVSPTYVSTRLFFSTTNPSLSVKYLNEVCDLGDRPHFVVTPEDTKVRGFWPALTHRNEL